jgi:hypothetical protein
MRPGTAASFVDIPYGTDAASTFKSALTHFLQKQGKSPPTIEIVDTSQVGPHEALVSAKVGAIDGQGPTVALRIERSRRRVGQCQSKPLPRSVPERIRQGH